MAGNRRWHDMQYVMYFSVATPLVLGWLVWASATTVPPQTPLISPTGLNAIADEAPAVTPKLAARPVTKALADNSDLNSGHQASANNG